MVVSFRDLVVGLRSLGVEPDRPVIAHASLSAFGEVRGGAETVIGALLSVFPQLMMPAFTFKCCLVPEDGPADNGIQYGTGRDLNQMAEFFTPDMPVDKIIGVIPESLRKHPQAKRSIHPLLSFTGVGVAPLLEMQTLQEPLAPIRGLTAAGGYVLLLGVDQTVNTSIHYAEKLAGRKQFVRWALTLQGVKECPAFPGCSDGFDEADPYFADFTRQTTIGGARVRAIPLAPMVDAVKTLIEHDPLALLCKRSECERCDAVRQAAQA